MTNDDSTPPPDSAVVPPPKPFAWQPLTPRGVAAFAHASFSRVLVVELVIAGLAAAAVVWFLWAAWFPAVRQAAQQSPEQGTLRNQTLDSPLAAPAVLAENRPYLMFVLDLEGQRNASQTSDVVVEFHRKNFQVCSLFGCLRFDYPRDWTVEFNRLKLVPLWEAWEPILLCMAALSAMLVLLVAWALLATLYSGLVRLLGFFKDRDLNWAGSWRLASASLMPGALLLAAGVVCYGLGLVDLLRLLLLFILHFIVGWIYLAVSPLCVPRLPEVLPPGVNPFATPGSQPKPEPRPRD